MAIFTLRATAVDPAEPVCHVSFYEADAFARWTGGACRRGRVGDRRRRTAAGGNLVESGQLPPNPTRAGVDRPSCSSCSATSGNGRPAPMSPIRASAPVAGAIGEYNGKFMSNQMVLRGGAAVTPADHMRITYRNFFPPSARWAFSGLRLAEDI